MCIAGARPRTEYTGAKGRNSAKVGAAISAARCIHDVISPGTVYLPRRSYTEREMYTRKEAVYKMHKEIGMGTLQLLLCTYTVPPSV